MAGQIIEVPTMHEDHRNWQSEHSMWEQDLGSWKKQIESVSSQLEMIQGLLNHQLDELAVHHVAIVDQEKSLLAHEHDLANCERLGMDYRETMTQKHLDLIKRFEAARKGHERIKKSQRELMVKLLELKKSFPTTT